MGVNSTHSLYSTWVDDWGLIETLLNGERALKKAGETYLPRLSGQTDEEYTRYLARGSLFNAAARTLQGLVGAIIRKEADINVSENVMNILKDITLARQSIHEVIRLAVEHILSYGFYGLLVDMPEGDDPGKVPYIALYQARDILNWKTEKIGGEEKIMMVVLKEIVKEAVDEFTSVDTDQIRVLLLDATTGAYIQRIYRKVDGTANEEWTQYGADILPKKQGLAMQEIPFVFINASSASPFPSKPPLLDVANINVKHWQLSTDYFHGLHFCAMPTPWAAGFQVAGSLFIGAEKAWISDDPNAKCGYLEFTGTGLGALEKALDKLEKLMAVLGARLLEEQKAGVEAARAIELRTSGDSATLVSIVSAVEEGVGKALEFVVQWIGDTKEPEIEMNRNFVSQKLTPQEITALLQAVQAGQISQDTFLYNLQNGEVLPPDRTIDEEKKIIESEAPKQDFTNQGIDEFGNPIKVGKNPQNAGGQNNKGGQGNQE
ncbi:MAG: DUF4055 domain-containing protein [Candidatus Colwellbacteria bacterium]|nr:DUF4055 domain-containing protein [Candidatus Colwellbacteria bacterium]